MRKISQEELDELISLVIGAERRVRWVFDDDVFIWPTIGELEDSIKNISIYQKKFPIKELENLKSRLNAAKKKMILRKMVSKDSVLTDLIKWDYKKYKQFGHIPT